MLTSQTPHTTGDVWRGDRERTAGIGECKEKLTVTVILRTRSPPVKCGLVQQFSRPNILFDAVLDTKTAPAPLSWTMISVPGKRNSKI